MGVLHRLSDKAARAAGPGRYADGGGLYLQVRKTEDGKNLRRSWIFKYATGQVVISMHGKERRAERELGLGSYPDISLAEARERALDARKKRAEGVDPIDARRAAKAGKQAEAAKAMTFKKCGVAYIKSKRAGWRNPKHAAQWEATLATYADPIIGDLVVQSIDTALVVKVLEQDLDGKPLWEARPETASRLRGRIECILDWARVREFREGENPARWRGHLDHLLPARRKVRDVKHHAAMAHTELPAFMTELKERSATAARALEFLIHTNARTGMVIGAQWGEFDLKGKVWTVPAPRMKGGKEHRIPLSDPALAIVTELERKPEGEFVFPGDSREQLSNMALLMLLRRMKRDDFTAHGFRATFKTWASDETSFPNELIEVAMAHTVGSKAEQAYQRGDLFEKRRKLMDAWSAFCRGAA
jgi:integrase